MWRAAQHPARLSFSAMERIFQALARSPFRARFYLDSAARAYVQQQGMETIRRHAADFVRTRLAPAVLPNDGRQTPMRGHPVFTAQHACACCCRGCLAKWHGLPAGRELTADEQTYIVSFLMAWIERRLALPAHAEPKKKPRSGPLQGEFYFGA